MAELNNTSPVAKKSRGVKRLKKLSTRVDLTPMVDLGFLLITFFIFTTTMSEPKALKLFLPRDADPEDWIPVKRSAVITLMPGKNDLVYYYEGDDILHTKNCTFTAIRDVILDKKRRTNPTWFQVILKPSRDATYQNVVNILDEMVIDGVNHYSLVDISPDEYKVMQAE